MFSSSLVELDRDRLVHPVTWHRAQNRMGGAGRLAADLMARALPAIDRSPFGLSRLVDGSRLGPAAAM